MSLPTSQLDPALAQRAQAAIDQAHGNDPEHEELTYAQRMESWLLHLHPTADHLLRLAARCQHLERWTVPRASFAADRVGYLTWRKSLYVKQAARAVELLVASGVPSADAERVRIWVSKTDLTSDSGSQALEDAACLVFLAHEFANFAATHPDYTAEKVIAIVQKTWRKMSEPARQMALSDIAPTLPKPLLELVQRALA